MTQRRSLMMAALALGAPGLAHAQETYPSRPIRIVVANPPGGVGDVISRTLGERAGKELNATFIIDNRPGASTTIGTTFAARSEPDGYTILSLTSSGIVATLLQERLGYQLDRDFVPIIGVGSFPMALAVSNTSNIRSIQDLAAAAKSERGLTYGSGGAGTMAHLAAVRLLNELGGKGAHVPFRGNTDALQAMAGGHIEALFPSVSEVPPLLASGSLRVLAVTARERLPSLPDVPTMAELGFADFTPRLWYGFLAPARVPAPILARLHTAFATALRDPAVQQRLVPLGFSIEGQDPESTARYIREDAARWRAVIQANNLRATD